MKGTIFFYLLAAVFFVSGNNASAKEVTLIYKGVTLNANLETAKGHTFEEGVILITHGGLAHRDMELIRYLQSELKGKGYNNLAINLSLGIDNRHGMYDCGVTHQHSNDDAAREIGAWVQWLEEKGAKNVVLLGHSRGGAQTALYASDNHGSLVKSVILMAPATADNTSAATYNKRYGRPLAPTLERAQKLVKERKADAVLEHVGLMACGDTSARADTFVSYYGQSQSVDAPYLLTKITQPTLVIVAGDDEVVIGLEKKIEPLLDSTRRQMTVIDGAEHFFRDFSADEAVEAIDVFLKDLEARP